jgi:hypothetical protein
MCFQDIFLQLQWHGNGYGCGSSCDLANFPDVSKSRVSDDIVLALGKKVLAKPSLHG